MRSYCNFGCKKKKIKETNTKNIKWNLKACISMMAGWIHVKSGMGGAPHQGNIHSKNGLLLFRHYWASIQALLSFHSGITKLPFRNYWASVQALLSFRSGITELPFRNYWASIQELLSFHSGYGCVKTAFSWFLYNTHLLLHTSTGYTGPHYTLSCVLITVKSLYLYCACQKEIHIQQF